MGTPWSWKTTICNLGRLVPLLKSEESVMYWSSYFNCNPRHADERLVKKFDCFLSIFWGFEPNISDPSIWNKFYIRNGCEFLKVFPEVILSEPRLGKVFDEDS